MHHLPHHWYFLLFAISFIAGAINSVAGGGTLLTFPSLLAAGISPVIANATSTISLVPGSVAGAFSFRKELPSVPSMLKLFALPAILGGFIGAKLMLVSGDELLSRLIPWLILGAAILFLVQEPLSRRLNLLADPDDDSRFKKIGVAIFVLIVSIYGGYFGAGMGILTLAALGFLGLTNIHQMNGVKNILAATINLVATITFICDGKVDWIIALMMAAGATLGGLSGGGVALKIGPKRVRQVIVCIGFGIAAIMFWRQWH
jgi:uncharacterized membrane protein YfcA